MLQNNKRKGPAVPESKRRAKPNPNKTVSQRRRQRNRKPRRISYSPPQMAQSVSAIPPNLSQSSAFKWTEMMVDPKDSPLVLAPNPGGVGTMVASARFNFVRDITYDAATSGFFTVIATPQVKDPLILMSTSPRYPAAGNANIAGTTIGLTFGPSPPVGATAGDPLGGWMTCTDMNTSDNVALVNSSIVASHVSWAITNPIGNFFHLICNNKGDQTRNFKFGYYDGAWVFDAAVRTIANGATVDVGFGPAAANITAFTIVWCSAAGVPQNPSRNVSDLVFSMYTLGFIPPVTSPGTVGSFVSDELATQGQIDNVRVTAMSILISPVGQWANIGGEVVVARTLAQNIVHSQTVAQIMSSLQQNNDPGCTWKNIPLIRGGYAWWMPDDSSSYAVHEYNRPPALSENILIAAGQMQPGNTVRITATFVVEFYSPKQIFLKRQGPALDGQYQQCYDRLLTLPCVTENEGHEEFIASVKRTMRNVLKAIPHAVAFAAEHASEISEAAELVSGLIV